MSDVYAHKASRKLPRLSFLLAGFPRRVGVVTVFSTLHPLEPNQECRQTKSFRPQKRSFVFIKSDSSVGFRRCHQACKKSYGLPMTIRGVLRGLKVCQLS